ncbi:hypothetical protein E2C01_040303 [Portunus trituberculatus]|uniref:Uncharacterized protein n=1 Tax=Portunus trituberculatus TaxID=210409 RepID=A0A5B7FH63_PORTR|nr:hypothetical protein [Portunus trituberculatus]
MEEGRRTCDRRVTSPAARPAVGVKIADRVPTSGRESKGCSGDVQLEHPLDNLSTSTQAAAGDTRLTTELTSSSVHTHQSFVLPLMCKFLPPSAPPPSVSQHFGSAVTGAKKERLDLHHWALTLPHPESHPSPLPHQYHQ